MASKFRARVVAFIVNVPRGKVVSYGQVAASCGSHRAARQVGGILRSLKTADGKVPWWRVVNSQGIISIKGNWTATKELQAKLLKKEGIKISKDLSLDMAAYRY